ncbi:TetR/AcrR family transcriptional regulator [Gleimia hominis]|uniref:TetR/AcrR family transcriptional regulator n=1 Tax=Gleimia hominis TaxID=595468 RepID=UPI000C809B92|nr:TetR/AcrR family transcriptional regulator [Gleimia hominis]WIK65033.1 TetR/AcrR family transcriptional regulator [Gleimia hominis]
MKRTRENTRARMIAAAASVFANKGVAGATIDDLTTAAEFTRGAFYSNFSSKEEAFAATFEDFTARLVDKITTDAQKLLRQDPPEQAVSSILESIRPMGRLWVLLDAEAVRQSLHNEQIRGVYLRSRQQVADVIVAELANRTEAASGQPKASAVDARRLATFCVGAYSEAIIAEHLQGVDSTQRLVGTIVSLLEAVRQPKGSGATEDE